MTSWERWSKGFLPNCRNKGNILVGIENPCVGIISMFYLNVYLLPETISLFLYDKKKMSKNQSKRRRLRIENSMNSNQHPCRWVVVVEYPIIKERSLNFDLRWRLLRLVWLLFFFVMPEVFLIVKFIRELVSFFLVKDPTLVAIGAQYRLGRW